MLTCTSSSPAAPRRTSGPTKRVAARLTAVGTAACAALTLWPAAAHAVADDAVQGCGAYNVIANDRATVPSSTQNREIFHVSTTDGRFGIKCGNGTSAGAVHIEVKHQVPDWADALSCITKAIDKTNGDFVGPTGKTTYTYKFSSTTVIVVTGGVGIITAYPKGSGVATKWRNCSTS